MALRVADLAIDKQPNNVRALVTKGDALYAMGQLESAQRAYRAAVAIDPSAAAAQVGLGRTLARSDPQTAETAFLAALKQEPDNVVALNDVGVMWDVQGRHDEAQKAYRHALTVSPDSIDVQVNLGRSLALSGHSEQALELLRAIAGDSGASQQWRAELATALSIAGDARSAQRLLAAGGTEAPQNVSPHTELAQKAPAERVADASGAMHEPPDTAAAKTSAMGPARDARGTGDLPDTAPKLATAPRVAVAQSYLPPILTPRSGTPDRGKPQTGQIDAVAVAAEMTGPISTLSAIHPGEPTVAPPSKPALTPAPEPRSTEADGPYVQLASLLSEPDALFEWRRLDRRYPELLAGHEPVVTTAGGNGRLYWRLRTFGFASMEQATELCGRLASAGFRCFSGRGL